jgi:hypothetical protein
MKPITLHPLHLPPITFPRWGWRLFVVAVAALGCLPAVIVRYQIQATLEEFDANRVRDVRQVREALADASRRIHREPGEDRERESVVLR